MIANSRKSTLSRLVTRHFEFTRLQKRFVASAYETLVPIVALRLGANRNRSGARPKAATRSDVHQSSHAGA
jgi:hypothetical protein